MRSKHAGMVPGSRLRPIAGAVAGLFAVSAPGVALADNWTVNSCSDANTGNAATKTGTLRYALLHAVSPALIDMSGLTGANACANSRISLSTGNGGELETALTTLTIDGPGKTALLIDADPLPSAGGARVLKHTGTGKLTIKNVALGGGKVYEKTLPSTGGCLYSNGSVELDSVIVQDCIAENTGTTFDAAGGGIFAYSSLTMNDSTVQQCHATATSTRNARGGGVSSSGDVTANDSYFYSNSATAQSGTARGGAILTLGKTQLSGVEMLDNGAYSGTGKASGGAVYSTGDFSAGTATIKNSVAQSSNGQASGGGIYAHGAATLTLSSISGNSAFSAYDYGTSGGGIQVRGDLLMSYTTLSGNSATGLGSGGGLHLSGQSNSIFNSTISGNKSDHTFAGIGVVTNGAASSTFRLVNSTISRNQGKDIGGGLYADTTSVKLYNSTIAFNTSTGFGSGPGVLLKPPPGSMAVVLQSTLMANNTYGVFEDDLDVANANPLSINGGNLATPANNLIRSTSLSVNSLPSDTKIAVCPHLGPLRANGGFTQTHALMSGSLAIDAGNNALNQTTDQRGSAFGPYPRISGATGVPNPKPDIGAYEVEQNEIVFNADFEDCP